MHFLRIITLLSLILVITNTSAAIFEVINQSNHSVWFKPFWGPGDPDYQELKPGETRKYNSGLYSISLMRWKLSPTSSEFFDTGNNVSIGALVLNGRFMFWNEGKYMLGDTAFGAWGLGPTREGTAKKITQ